MGNRNSEYRRMEEELGREKYQICSNPLGSM
jgi:hypothetical protein